MDWLGFVRIGLDLLGLIWIRLYWKSNALLTLKTALLPKKTALLPQKTGWLEACPRLDVPPTRYQSFEHIKRRIITSRAACDDSGVDNDDSE